MTNHRFTIRGIYEDAAGSTVVTREKEVSGYDCLEKTLRQFAEFSVRLILEDDIPSITITVVAGENYEND